eukprot:TRINITY_DN928_c0_g1_i8.p2 TRINITY_DN928_c0_g1~~TRINITY_DN928_c0_g1_i8.p2  ORF type:complete len:104 (-),score=2.80 TRINITY_DN928_c0_g1_i8:144-455(-)
MYFSSGAIITSCFFDLILTNCIGSLISHCASSRSMYWRSCVMSPVYSMVSSEVIVLLTGNPSLSIISIPFTPLWVLSLFRVSSSLDYEVITSALPFMSFAVFK